MTRVIDISAAARRDVLGILNYFHERSAAAHNNFVLELDECFKTLSTSPMIGRVVRQGGGGTGRTPPLRAWTVSRRFHAYLVFYRVRSRDVRIIRVMHTSRDLHAILKLTD